MRRWWTEPGGFLLVLRRVCVRRFPLRVPRFGLYSTCKITRVREEEVESTSWTRTDKQRPLVRFIPTQKPSVHHRYTTSENIPLGYPSRGQLLFSHESSRKVSQATCQLGTRQDDDGRVWSIWPVRLVYLDKK